MKFTDTQLVILSQASQRNDRAVVLPERLRGATAQKVVKKLLEQQLLKEAPATRGLPAWRRGDDNEPLALTITDGGFAAIGIEETPTRRAGGKAATTPRRGTHSKPIASTGRKRTKPDKVSGGSGRAGRKSTSQGVSGRSKQDAVLAMLRKPNGASIHDMIQATGWQAHSVRGFLSGTVKKKLGLPLATHKRADGERRYHVHAATPVAAS